VKAIQDAAGGGPIPGLPRTQNSCLCSKRQRQREANSDSTARACALTDNKYGYICVTTR